MRPNVQGVETALYFRLWTSVLWVRVMGRVQSGPAPPPGIFGSVAKSNSFVVVSENIVEIFQSAINPTMHFFHRVRFVCTFKEDHDEQTMRSTKGRNS